MSLLLLSGAIILVAFFCESLFGFGGGLISIPLLSLLMPVKDAVILVMIFQFLIGVLILKTAKDTQWKVARYMGLGLFVGTLLGMYSLKIASEQFLRIFLGISVLAFLIKMMFFPKVNMKDGKHVLGFIAGLTGAYFQGIIGTGGPVFTMYLLSAVPNKQQFRATLIFIFFVTSALRILVAWQAGLISAPIWNLAWPLIFPFILMVFLGQRLHWKIPDTYYRWAVYIILFGSSLSLLLRR